LKVLIADDSPDMRALLRELCSNLACEMRDCANGAEAVAAFEEFRPDWTLMDIAMPSMDGLTATARICQSHPHARVLVVTQYPSPEYERAARDAGARGLLRKDELESLPAILSRNGPASHDMNREHN
jgi:two-component system, NarL family, response regulator